MSDNDLIRRGDALAATANLYRWSIAAGEELEATIAALPAVTQPAPDAMLPRCAECSCDDGDCEWIATDDDSYPYDTIEQCERDLDGVEDEPVVNDKLKAALRKVADKVYAKLSAKGLYAEAQSARDTILALLEKPHDRA